MKNHFKTITTTLLAIAGLAYLAPSAKAYTYTNGDMFLGFYDAATTNDYLLYIGNFSTYTTSGGVYTGAQITLNTANLGTNVASGIGSASTVNADLTAVFGSNWATNSAVKFGVVGIDVPNGTATVFISDGGATSSTTSFGSNTRTNQRTVGGDITSMAGTYGTGGANGATSTTGAIQAKASSFSYYDESALGTNGGQNNPNGADFEFYNGVSVPVTGSNVYLDELNPSNFAGQKPAGTDLVLGQFTVGSNGTITYAAPVPEPSTYAMMGIGCLMLVVMARRRASKVAA